MNDYSDLIYLMGAMIVFSLLSLQASRMFQMNNQVQINAEIEYHAVSIAQNEIDQIKWIKSESALNDHLNKFPKQVPLTVGNDTLFYNVNIDIADITIPNSNIKNKKVSVRVSNKFLKNNSNNNKGNRNIELGFIKSFN